MYNNGTLIYAGSNQQNTNPKEWPLASGPRNVTFNNNTLNGVVLNTTQTLNINSGVATVNGWLDFNGNKIGGTGTFVLNGPSAVNSFTGNTGIGSNIITNISAIGTVTIGMPVTGPGIPNSSFIIYIDPLNANNITLNTAATAIGTDADFTAGSRGGLKVNLTGGIDAHVQVSSTKTYNAGANYIFNTPTTGNQIYPAFPTTGILNYSPAWNVTFNAGINNRVIMGAGHDLKINNDLTLNTGIFVTNNNLITWDNNGGVLTSPNTPWVAHDNSYANSFIAICDNAGTPLTILDGTKGFRINNVDATNIYFPVAATFNPVGPGLPATPNRMMLNNEGPVNNFTTVINIGDILHTPSPVVERVWYVVPENAGDSKVTMRLYFTKRDPAIYPAGQNEVESGFDYTKLQLVQEDDSIFVRIANGADSLQFLGGFANNVDEIYGQYTVGISKDVNGNADGINYFTRFSVINAGGVILPVKIVDFKAYPQGDKGKDRMEEPG